MSGNSKVVRQVQSFNAHPRSCARNMVVGRGGMEVRFYPAALLSLQMTGRAMRCVVRLSQVIRIYIVMWVVTGRALQGVGRAVQRQRRSDGGHRLQGCILGRIVVHVHRVIVSESQGFECAGAEGSLRTNHVLALHGGRKAGL
jgi:hypothetical protein